MLCLYMYLKTIYSEEAQEFFYDFDGGFRTLYTHKIIWGGLLKKSFILSLFHFFLVNTK